MKYQLNNIHVFGGVAAITIMVWIVVYRNPYQRNGIAGSEDDIKAKGLDMWTTQMLTISVRTPDEESKLTKKDDRSDQMTAIGLSNLKKIYCPMFKPSEKIQIMNTLKVLTDALDKADIMYFLYGGSLIGSWRHHDIVPWDDDIDIILNISSVPALDTIKIPGYTMNTNTNSVNNKFYRNNATNITGYSWKWPFIDLCSFGDNGTHLYDLFPRFSKTFVFEKRDVFPLVRRPFGQLNVKAPKNTLKFLENNYHVSLCQTRNYDHRTEKSLPRDHISNLDCELLHPIYPFVIREPGSTSNIEKLYLNKELLHTVQLPTNYLKPNSY